MNILVCVKRVPLTGGKIVLTDDQRAISTKHLGFTVSPHEECGVEEAVQIVEREGGSVDGAHARPGRGRGAAARHDGDRRRPRDPPASPTARSGIRRRRLPRSSPRSERTSRAIRPDPVRQRVGRRRQLPGGDPRRARARAAVRDRGQGDRRRTTGSVGCEQEVPGGRDVYDVPLPAVVTVKEGLNLPRYPSVPGRLRAKRKPLDELEPRRVRPRRLEMVRLVLPPDSGKQVQVLGNGAEAAPAVVTRPPASWGCSEACPASSSRIRPTSSSQQALAFARSDRGRVRSCRDRSISGDYAPAAWAPDARRSIAARAPRACRRARHRARQRGAGARRRDARPADGGQLHRPFDVRDHRRR